MGGCCLFNDIYRHALVVGWRHLILVLDCRVYLPKQQFSVMGLQCDNMVLKNELHKQSSILIFTSKTHISICVYELKKSHVNSASSTFRLLIIKMCLRSSA